MYIYIYIYIHISIHTCDEYWAFHDADVNEFINQIKVTIHLLKSQVNKQVVTQYDNFVSFVKDEKDIYRMH